MAKERQVQDEHSSSLPSHWKEVQISESQGKFVQKLEKTSLVQLQSVLPKGKIWVKKYQEKQNKKSAFVYILLHKKIIYYPKYSPTQL